MTAIHFLLLLFVASAYGSSLHPDVSISAVNHDLDSNDANFDASIHERPSYSFNYNGRQCNVEFQPPLNQLHLYRPHAMNQDLVCNILKKLKKYPKYGSFNAFNSHFCVYHPFLLFYISDRKPERISATGTDTGERNLVVSFNYIDTFFLYITAPVVMLLAAMTLTLYLLAFILELTT